MDRKGFTLVEVVMVTAVLSVLVSVVTISLRTGKECSKSVVCAANLKQISLASFLYAQDYSTLPYGFNDNNNGIPPGGFVGNWSYDWSGWWWFHYLHDYLGQDLSPSGSLWCPSRLVLGNLSDNVLCSNYGANFSLFRIYDPHPQKEYQGVPVRPGSPRQSSNTVLIMDAGYSWVSWQAAGEHSFEDFPVNNRVDSFYLPGLTVNKQRTINPDQINDALNGRHLDKTCNVSFLDGHVKKTPSETLYVKEEAIQDGRYNKRYSPLNWSP